jgi:1-acyl-sn-glycerol-3-phosphate acyltransferase
MPVQLALKRLSPGRARTFPHWYHRQVLKLLGVRLHVEGGLVQPAGVLLVANHVSWLDIPVLSAVAPVSFVAKKEVASWPFIAWLARLQRTVFVDRERRTDAALAAGELIGRLKGGDTIVLFAEGTSGPGNRVLPFRTALFGAVKGGGEEPDGVAVQTLTIAYTRIHGLPVGRDERPMIGWYGDMEMAGHAWELLKLGPIDATVRIGPRLALSDFPDRKALARWCEDCVRADLAALLHGRAGHEEGAGAGAHGRASGETLEPAA